MKGYVGVLKTSPQVIFLIGTLISSAHVRSEALKVSSNESSTWSIKLKQVGQHGFNETSTVWLDSVANRIADEAGVENMGQIGQLKGYYLFKTASKKHHELENVFNSHEHVEWHRKQVFLKRTKRVVQFQNMQFKDPLYKNQWHLHNPRGFDCNVTGVWNQNITGKGVVVTVVDDGVEWRHPDLVDNYCPEGSFDLTSNDDDPTPEYDEKEDNKHGTRCAGEIAAVPNTFCGVGIAFGARFSAIRILDGPTTDSTEAVAFNKHMDVNDVYSCSWGPEDDGETVDGPHDLGKLALQHGVVAGRQGFGSVFVVASGNGGDKDDNCNYDGYAASIYTITIGAIDERGNKPSYAEQCSSMLACSVSSGSGSARSIVTTDWSLPPKNSKDQCTFSHTGTSAAAPLVAGMVALMLEARPCLTWRDIQHIIVMTALEVDHATAWTTNKAGFRHSDIHGFGILDAWRLVNAAKVWKSVPWLTSFTPDTSLDVNREIFLHRQNPLILKATASEDDCQNNLLSTIEYVIFTVTVSHINRGRLKFVFTCPSGTTSVVPIRKNDNSENGLKKWSFSTVKCWGENPAGQYSLKIIDTRNKLPVGETLGVLEGWQLIIYGSQWTANDMKNRKEYIKTAMSGQYMTNFSLPCPLGITLDFDVTSALSDRTIKLVVMISCFLLFWALYYSIEMAFCNAEDKEKKTQDTVNGSENVIEENTATLGYGGISTDHEQTFTNSTFVGEEEDVTELNTQELNDDLLNQQENLIQTDIITENVDDSPATLVVDSDNLQSGNALDTAIQIDVFSNSDHVQE